ncbi:hypothetical protein DNTS_008757, partial [Danionella cerebrum]
MSKDVVENKGVEQHQLGLQYNTLEFAVLVLFTVSFLWVIAAVRYSHCKIPLACQYSSVLLEETDLYITQELKKLAEGEAKSAGKKQLCEVREYLHLSPLPDCVVLGTFEFAAQTSEPQTELSETHKPEQLLTTNVQVIATQTQQQPKAVVLTNVKLTATPTQLCKLTVSPKSPLKSDRANWSLLCKPQISDVIVDALCGSGAIPLEGAMEWAMSFFLAGDNNGEAVSRSVSNVKHI